MSNALAIAGVTAVLKQMLNDGLARCDVAALQNATVSATAPDRVTTGQNEANQLNLFLYQLSSNPGWRNEGLPSCNSSGSRLTNHPLALDLHYILSAYGSEDLHSEILLGYGMQVLHETPVLTREKVRSILDPPEAADGTIFQPPVGSPSAAGLADQIELVKIAPVFLSGDDWSKLWTAMQARYRPSMAYIASVVLIQAEGAIQAAPPVLHRGKDDSGPAVVAGAFPALSAARPNGPDGAPAMRLGDVIVLSGTNLGERQAAVVFENARAAKSVVVPSAVTQSGKQLLVRVPSVAEDPDAINQWAIGLYNVSLRRGGPGVPLWSSNAVPIALAPLITLDTATAAAGDSLRVTSVPRLVMGQETRTVLILGSQSAAPISVDTPADSSQPTTLTFPVPSLPPGIYVARLRVDGIDSMPVRLTGTPPKLDFDPAQMVTIK